MKKILITGIPGMGKTCLGNKLKQFYNFEHIDMESMPTDRELLRGNREMFYNKVTKTEKDFVITWGFYPPNDNSEILFLKEKGFQLIWLDGNRKAALREYTRRCTEKDINNLEEHLLAFAEQIKRIDANDVINKIQPTEINTFNKAGQFKNFEQIINEINSKSN